MRCSAKTLSGRRCRSHVHKDGVCWVHTTHETITCSICLGDYLKECLHNKTLECGHIFCKRCINLWIIEKPESCSCPYCRTPISETMKLDARQWGFSTGELYWVVQVSFKWQYLSNVEQYYMTAFYNLNLDSYMCDSQYRLFIRAIQEDDYAISIMEELVKSCHTTRVIVRRSKEMYTHFYHVVPF
jgi:hypothetical protein